MHNLSKAEQDALHAGETLIPYVDEYGAVTWRKVPVNPGIGATASISFRPSSWVRWPPGSQASRWGGYAPGAGSIDDEFRTPADCERLTPPFEDKAMRLGDCEWVEGRGWFYRPGGVGRRRGRVNDKTLRRMTSRKTSAVPRCSAGTKPCSWSDANGNIHVGCCQTTQIRT